MRRSIIALYMELTKRIIFYCFSMKFDRQRLCRPKVTKFWLGNENFDQPKILPPKILPRFIFSLIMHLQVLENQWQQNIQLL